MKLEDLKIKVKQNLTDKIYEVAEIDFILKTLQVKYVLDKDNVQTYLTLDFDDCELIEEEEKT